MKIEKYDASGNTFVIFHTNEKRDYSKEAVTLCKEYDVDGLIVVVPHMVYDFQWLFYNNDGSEAAMCGNGTRAVAHYAHKNQIAGRFMKFLTGAGEINCNVDGDIVETTMTDPKILKQPFEQDGFTWYFADTGVPHLVTVVDDLEKFDLELCSKMRYEYNANVNFASVVDGVLYVRTYERGVENETGACGTGMVACFLRSKELGLIENIADVYPTSKEKLTIRTENGFLYFKGEVKNEGSFEVEI